MKNNNSNHKLFLTGLILTGAFVMSVGYSNNTHALAANPTDQGASNHQAQTSPHVLDPVAILVNSIVGIVVPVRFRNVEGISNAGSENAAGFSTSGATGSPVASQYASSGATGAAIASQFASQALTPVIG